MDISLHIMDIAQNSIDAGASIIDISIAGDEDTLTVTVADNGRGMDANTARLAQTPHYTTKAKSGGGLGIPLLKKACEMTGGS
ncbi:MAG: ATP-binding protein, partial [Oscillospiraceae bacterium]|nr:ATP-binding protein [Oscillospiraceae bacterium]